MVSHVMRERHACGRALEYTVTEGRRVVACIHCDEVVRTTPDSPGHAVRCTVCRAHVVWVRDAGGVRVALDAERQVAEQGAHLDVFDERTATMRKAPAGWVAHDCPYVLDRKRGRYNRRRGR